MNGIKRNCCPLCGADIIIWDRETKEHYSNIGKEGIRAKNASRSFHQRALCSNIECSVFWREGEFEIKDGGFYDLKYDFEK